MCRGAGVRSRPRVRATWTLAASSENPTVTGASPTAALLRAREIEPAADLASELISIPHPDHVIEEQLRPLGGLLVVEAALHPVQREQHPLGHRRDLGRRQREVCDHL